MTHYDRLMDAIKDQLYQWYLTGVNDDGWDESDAQESAVAILKAVEEFQEKRVKLSQWRASD